MKLSPDEAAFVRQWVFDEANYLAGTGPAKRLQVDSGVSSAEFATLVAAAYPSANDQAVLAFGQGLIDAATWPWSGDQLRRRIEEARAILAERRPMSAMTA